MAPTVTCPYARGRKGCHCPTSYSRCLGWVKADHEAGDHSRGHGGWGWPSEEVLDTEPEAR